MDVIIRRVLTTAALVLLSHTILANVGDRVQSPIKVEFLASYGCDYILLMLDNAVGSFRQHPNATVSVIAYPGKDSPPGKVLQHLVFAKDYLENKDAAIKNHSVSLGVGPAREELMLEIWIAPPGTTAPASKPFAEHYGLITGKYDEGGMEMLPDKGKWILVAQICSLENVYFHGFAEALKAVPASTGYIVLRPYENSATVVAKRELWKVGHIPARQLKIIKGQPRKHIGAELWVVPRGAKPPRPQ